MTLTNALGGTLRPSDVILTFIYIIAVGALIPYWTQPVAASGSSAATLLADTLSQIFGLGPYLLNHPLRALAILPATLHLSRAIIMRPVR